MPRTLTILAGAALALILSLPVHGQDSPSLGDLARQAQLDREKNKSGKPASKVLTNDDLPAGSGGEAAIFGGGFGQPGPSAGDHKSAADLSPAEKIARAESVIDRLETLDRATLVKNALQGKDADFLGRAKWEDRLAAAKLVYVSRIREVIQEAKEIIASSDSLKGHQDTNDPRVKEMGARLQSLVRNAVQADSDFQAVIIEGRDLAAQTPVR
jgi:hypothetical protein